MLSAETRRALAGFRRLHFFRSPVPVSSLSSQTAVHPQLYSVPGPAKLRA